MFFLSILVDASTISRSTFLGKALSNAGNVLRWSIVFAGLLTLYFTQTKNWTHKQFGDDRSLARVAILVFLHLLLYVVSVVLTVWIFKVGQTISAAQSFFWTSIVLATATTWCLIIVNFARWRFFLSKEKSTLLWAGICSLIIVIAGTFFQRFWEVLNAFTLSGTRLVLELLYDNIYFDFAEKKLGVPEFWVFVDSACSGIEGIVVAVSTTSIYLFLSRDQLRFPHSLALIPIACIFSILLNILRIAVLITIGIEYSPKLAVEGFHSVAGWLAAVAVALIIIFVFSSWKWIQRTTNTVTPQNESDRDYDLAIAILAPFAVFIGLTLFGRMLSTEFDYFYPLKITLTAAVLAYYWKRYELRLPDNTVQIVIAGVLTTVLWIAFVDRQPEVDSLFLESVAEMPLTYAVIWVVWRAASFWVVVPIFEELLFRGYLLSRFANVPIRNTSMPPVHWMALLVTSILFGLIHQAWIAGFIAGLIFGWLRFKSNKLTSCIFAHGLANFLITLWALYSGRWSLI